jgi:hypothetical protein
MALARALANGLKIVVADADGDRFASSASPADRRSEVDAGLCSATSSTLALRFILDWRPL